jgi:hypothetical protein
MLEDEPVREADVVEAGLREPVLDLLGHGQAGEHRGERESSSPRSTDEGMPPLYSIHNSSCAIMVVCLFAEQFLAIAHRVVWCTMATVDRRNRPRSRIVHPVWEISEGTLHGLVGTRPTPLKRAHLAHAPHVSCTYWDPAHDVAVAECAARWLDEAGAPGTHGSASRAPRRRPATTRPRSGPTAPPARSSPSSPCSHGASRRERRRARARERPARCGAPTRDGRRPGLGSLPCPATPSVNLKEVEDQAPKFGYAPHLESRFARKALGLRQSGSATSRSRPASACPSAIATKTRRRSTSSWPAARASSSATTSSTWAPGTRSA